MQCDALHTGAFKGNEMKPFKLDNDPCPKCGYNEKPAAVKYQVGIFDPHEQTNTDVRGYIGPSKYYILRTCHLCGYRWAEATLDTELL
jgi:predicted nucleic-acid-binding Zn-ribbon protein